jgi:hypothetical protein
MTESVTAPPANTATPVAPAAGDQTSAAPIDATKPAPAPEQKPTAAVAPVIPEKYEFKGQDGNPLLADEVVAEWAPLFKELGLDNAKAQRLAEFQIQQQAVLGQQLTKAIDDDRVLLQQEAKADKDFGGLNYDTNTKYVEAALAKYGNARASALLKDSGLGNDVGMLSLFANVGKAIPKNDQIPGQVGNTGVAKPKSMAERLFPNTPNSV